jgi:hypothetical protein
MSPANPDKATNKAMSAAYKYAALMAKLDLDGGVTDTNYAATVGLAAAQFTRI